MWLEVNNHGTVWGIATNGYNREVNHVSISGTTMVYTV